jgi:glycerol-3-phosphate acyltransferase PlsY
MTWPWAALLGYALGSIPVAWLVVRAMTGLDLRRVGSGNVGAANALRATRWSAGLAVAMIDIVKGSAAVGIVAAAGGDVAARALGGCAAVAGHVFPVWLRFQGGKGVATAAGVFTVLAPAAALVAAVVFVALAATTRLVSLASIVGAGTLSAATWLTAAPAPVSLAAVAVAALVITRHHANIVRIWRGTERRLGRKGLERS